MFSVMPIYRNFPFLNGDMDSFSVDDYFIFVLMPFGSTEKNTKKTFDEIFHTIEETIEKGCFHGGMLRCSRADFQEGLIIMEDICSKIKKAALTIFDISLPNPNVYLELGLACALDKKILLVYNPKIYYSSQPDQKIPFDINQFRYIEYRTNEELRQKLKPKVESLLKVKDTTRIDLEQIYRKLQKISRHFGLDSRSEEIREDFNISDYEIEMACKVLDEYLDEEKYIRKDYKNVAYHEIELKIRSELGTHDWNRVKMILIAIYWSGLYRQLIANMDRLPTEFGEVRRDFGKES